MINYSDLLINNNYLKSFSADNVYDWSTFIFNPPTDKPSQETIDQWIKDIPFKACKKEAKRRIAEYDWVIDTETTPDLLNRQDFIAYRSALRQLILNPVENPVWPEVPQEVWKND